ncbi:MAG: hypothetical protein R3Y65_00780 [Bacillota bacterium]
MRRFWIYIKNNTGLIEGFIIDGKQIITAVIGSLITMLFGGSDYFLICFLFFVLVLIARTIVTVNDKNSFDLIKMIKRFKEEERWVDIIKVGYPISGQLWDNGYYKLRVEVGEILSEALNKVNQHEVVVTEVIMDIEYMAIMNLIDALGWTMFVLGKECALAERNIEDGINKAKCAIEEVEVKIKEARIEPKLDRVYIDKLTDLECQLTCLEAKGHRHLCGIYANRKDNSNFQREYEQVKILCNQICTKLRGKYADYCYDILLGCELAQVEAMLDEKKFNDAIKYLDSIKSSYSSFANVVDKKLEKAHLLYARIFCGLNQRANAKEHIDKGLQLYKYGGRQEYYARINMAGMEYILAHFKNVSTYEWGDKLNFKREINRYYKAGLGACMRSQNSLLVEEMEKTKREALSCLKKIK